MFRKLVDFFKKHMFEATPQPPVPRDLTLIVAGNYRQFMFWCKSHNKSPQDPNVVFVNNVESVLGRGPRIKAVWYVGTWRERRDMQQIKNQLSLYSAVYDLPIPYFFEDEPT